MKILKIPFHNFQMLVATKHIRAKFYTNDLLHEKVLVLNSLKGIIIKDETNFIGLDTTSGVAFFKEFVFLEDCLNWLKTT